MHAPTTYLETEVMSASQPKLRLMLIEAALRLARQSLRLDHERAEEARIRTLSHLGRILLHLLGSVESNGSPIARKIQVVYVHLFKTVAEARLKGDVSKIVEVAEILEVEVDTWRTITQQYTAEMHPTQQTWSVPVPDMNSRPARSVAALASNAPTRDSFPRPSLSFTA